MNVDERKKQAARVEEYDKLVKRQKLLENLYHDLKDRWSLSIGGADLYTSLPETLYKQIEEVVLIKLIELQNRVAVEIDKI